MIRELRYWEFDERYMPIFEAVEARAGHPDKFDPDWFFPRWRQFMAQGVARTWVGEGCVIGVIFSKNTFTGQPVALVEFWFSDGTSNEAGQLLSVVESHATACRSIYSAAYVTLNHEAMGRKYQQHGYTQSESIFRKELQ